MSDATDRTDTVSRRALMLDRIRTGISDGGTVKVRSVAVAARLKGQAPHLVPERANKDAAGKRALFAEFLTGQAATVLDVTSDAEIPAAIAGYELARGPLWAGGWSGNADG